MGLAEEKPPYLPPTMTSHSGSWGLFRTKRDISAGARQNLATGAGPACVHSSMPGKPQARGDTCYRLQASSVVSGSSGLPIKPDDLLGRRLYYISLLRYTLKTHVLLGRGQWHSAGRRLKTISAFHSVVQVIFGLFLLETDYGHHSTGTYQTQPAPKRQGRSATTLLVCHKGLRMGSGCTSPKRPRS